LHLWSLSRFSYLETRCSFVQLDEEAIGRIETIRDLLREVTEAKEGGGEAPDPMEHPEKVLTDRQKQWLTPLGLGMERAARGLFSVNRSLVRGLSRLRVDGQGRLPQEGPFIIAPNHLSYLDPFMIAAALTNDQRRLFIFCG
jgi:long-chain acyl-CoA synthetase